ncbi:MAG: RHS repeat-associated core domain-containing protein [Bacteroidia bacterium]
MKNTFSISVSFFETYTGRFSFGFNGKEKDNELYGTGNAYDYGMRMYDARLGRFMSVDPLTAKYPMLTPFQFSSNTPIAGIDRDGLEFYYKPNGQFIKRIGKSQQVFTADDVEVQKTKTATVFVPINPRSLNINHSEFIKFAGTAYGESSVGDKVYNKKEVWGIASAMLNYKKISGKSVIAYASSNPNAQFKIFSNTSDKARNGTFQQTAIAGAINALTDGVDYSNGGTNWAGNDIASPKEKWAEGLRFSSQADNLFGLKNNAKPGVGYFFNKAGKETGIRGTYDYKWETTAAYGGIGIGGKTYGTTFMKVTDEYKKATGAKGN